jgi:hypothetical protein
MSIFKKRKRKEKHKYTTDAITFNKSGAPKEHPFKDREFKGAFGTDVKEKEYPYNIE